jgi:hypothetical protein
MPSTSAGSRPLSEARHIDHELDPLAACGEDGSGERTCGAPELRLRGQAAVVVGAQGGVGIDDEHPRVAIEDGVGAAFEIIDVEADEHWHTARARQNRDMARRTAPAQHQAAVAPVGRKEYRGRHVVGRDDGAWRHGLIGLAREAPQHAVAQIAQVGGTGAKIGIVGLIVVRDFRIDRLGPCPIGGFASDDQRIGRRHEILILEQRDLKRQHSLRIVIFDLVGERRQVALRHFERVVERVPLCRDRTGLARLCWRSRQAHQRSQRDPRRSGPPLDAMACARAMVHPGNLRRPASPARRARLLHPLPPHENRWSRPLAPWSPSP